MKESWWWWKGIVKKLASNSTSKKLRLWCSVPLFHGKQMGKKMETVTHFIFLGSKITADGDCSYEIQRRLLLGRKAMINLDSIFKSRGIALPTKVFQQSRMDMRVGLWRKLSTKNWCFWTVVLEKTLESPLNSKEIQSIHPKEISPECSLEGLMLKLKLQ